MDRLSAPPRSPRQWSSALTTTEEQAPIGAVEIVDPTDLRVDEYARLTDSALRRVREPAEGLFIAESRSVIERAIRAGYQPRSVLCEPRWLPRVAGLGLGEATPIHVAAPEVLTALTGYRVHRGLLAAMSRRPLPPVADVLADASAVLVLDGLVDHTNVGAAFRSAAALGLQAVLVTGRCADPLYRRSVRVSMGAVFDLPWTRVPGWPTVPELDRHTTVALTPDPKAPPLASVLDGGPVALVVGTEGHGLDAAVQRRCDVRARIPMSAGIDSLNVAAAVAVACYQVGLSAASEPG